MAGRCFEQVRLSGAGERVWFGVMTQAALFLMPGG